MKRISDLPTLGIDPDRCFSFTYDGRPMAGVRGDTVATALYAAGVRIFSRSVKYHRPRGLYSLDGECSNCLLEVDGLPNTRGEVVALRPGMRVTSQNCVGSPEHDLLGFMDRLSWAMPAGFYYRIFHKPYRLWPFFMKRIRRMSGIGRFQPGWQVAPADERHLHCDVCVIGAGPAGMAAAESAAGRGLRVVLLEARNELGGFYRWRRGNDAEETPLYERARKAAETLEAGESPRIFRNARVMGIWGDNLVTAFQTGAPGDRDWQRYIEVRATSVVVATGCLERPLIFENNERPGVMQVGCAHRLAHQFGLVPERRAVFSVGDDLGLEAARDLADLGLEIACVADCRSDGQDPGLVEALYSRRIAYLPGWCVVEARGRKTVSGCTLGNLNGPGSRREACDLLVASAGVSAHAGLLFMAEAKMRYDSHTGLFLPTELPPRVHAAGRLLGWTDPQALEQSGMLAGLEAAADAGGGVRASEIEAVRNALGWQPPRANRVVSHPGIGRGRKSFVCFDEDVTVAHLRQSCDSGFDLPELAKRYTAAGTGPGQGGIPGNNLPLILAQLRGHDPGDILPTTVRPPLVPVRFSTLAGRNPDIHKRTPLHRQQQERGAVFRRIGSWQRARGFRTDLSVRDEVLNVRNGVGMIDVSTLGKFRIFGRDAEKALNRVYVGDMSRVPEGRVIYSAMVNEHGCLVDDGVITRTGENDFYFTTSTGRAAMTVEWIRYHCRHEDWDFHLVNLTDALAAINVAGPRARRVLAALTESDIENEAFPYLGYRQMVLGERVPARVMRLGFVGELSYEIHVGASYAPWLWQRLLAAGKDEGLAPFGLEAQNLLRLEKGHVIIGRESEIRTTLHDLGLGFLWHRNKADALVGETALRLTEHQEGRLKLAGVEVDDPERAVRDGAVIVSGDILGHLGTVRFSETLQRTIGLALVRDDFSRIGTELDIFQAERDERRFRARVVTTPFYDPQGQRVRM